MTKPEHLPLGFASAFTAGRGVTGAILGMVTEWFLSTKIGDPAFSGDICFELNCAFSAIVYPIARTTECRLESPALMRLAADSAAERAAQEKQH